MRLCWQQSLVIDYIARALLHKPKRKGCVKDLSRRSFLQLSALLAAELAIAHSRALADTAVLGGDRYVTSFYQFNEAAIRRLSQKNALPNGPRFEHIFCQSTPGARAFPELTRMVHAAGASFKFAWAYDAHKHRGWERAGDDDLRKWADEFRTAAFTSDAPPDYFAFNEMPPDGHKDADTRDRVTKLVRYLHDGGNEGGPKWRGLFYFVEPNTNPAAWKGDAQEFWETLDQCCDHVVAEHYHTDAFVFSRTVQQMSDHLFTMAHWLADSGSAPQANIAAHKFAILHSSYWGRGYSPWTSLYRDLCMGKIHPDPAFYQAGRITPWEGMLNDEHESAELEKFFQRCVAATRADDLGKSRIAFGPLAISQPMGPAMLPMLARVLGKDAAKFQKEGA